MTGGVSRSSVEVAATPTWQDYDSAGMRVNYIVVEFDEQDGAQEEYEDFVHQTDMEIKAKEELSVESAYVSYLKKASVRLAKFALIIHTHAQLQGANATPCEFEYEFDDVELDEASLSAVSGGYGRGRKGCCKEEAHDEPWGRCPGMRPMRKWLFGSRV